MHVINTINERKASDLVSKGKYSGKGKYSSKGKYNSKIKKKV